MPFADVNIFSNYNNWSPDDTSYCDAPVPDSSIPQTSNMRVQPQHPFQPPTVDCSSLDTNGLGSADDVAPSNQASTGIIEQPLPIQNFLGDHIRSYDPDVNPSDIMPIQSQLSNVGPPSPLTPSRWSSDNEDNGSDTDTSKRSPQPAASTEDGDVSKAKEEKKNGKPGSGSATVKRPKLENNLARSPPALIDLTLDDTDMENFDNEIDLECVPEFVVGDCTFEYPIHGTDRAYVFTPKFHRKEDLNWFNSLDAAVREGLSRPSSVKLVPSGEFSGPYNKSLTGFLQTHAAVLVKGTNQVNKGFDKSTLSGVCNLYSVTTIHDTIRTRKGSLVDLFAAASSTLSKALSALNLPAKHDPFPELPISGEWFAWDEVTGQSSYCDSSELYPLRDMRWALASTGSAHHYWHIDANGFGTFVRVETGLKLWFLARPKSGSFEDFATVEIFTDKFLLYESNSDLWDVELVVNPVMFCGHYYLAETLSDSIIGLYNHFVGSDSLTNTDHSPASHALLIRMLAYYYAYPNNPSNDTSESGSWDRVMYNVLVYDEGDDTNDEAASRLEIEDKTYDDNSPDSYSSESDEYTDSALDRSGISRPLKARRQPVNSKPREVNGISLPRGHKRPIASSDEENMIRNVRSKPSDTH
ncbi:hypothetical protein C0995_003969 [Termitomyces sp. Mi166|nr:hypothetical protein C0995_003969 [Termitomyces sp. Mi166\